jgi:hypothetical protein
MCLLLRTVQKELQAHAPFTAVGALSGILILALTVSIQVQSKIFQDLFWSLHPIHVFLSALVTASVFRLRERSRLWLTIIIGYSGSVGIATLSDSMIPYLGEWLLGLPGRETHIGFIEKWWLVNPLGILGVVFALKWPNTKFPHAGHVFISTWASLFHMLMAIGNEIDLIIGFLIFIFLFLAVWIPCCTSDIVFPLLFTRPAQVNSSNRSKRLKTFQLEKR